MESFDPLEGDALVALFRWKAKGFWYGVYDYYDNSASAYLKDKPIFDNVFSSLLLSMETSEAQMCCVRT